MINLKNINQIILLIFVLSLIEIESKNYGQCFAQEFDLFPLNIGNWYQYEYTFSDSEDWMGYLDYILIDSGLVEYEVTDSIVSNDTIAWIITQLSNIERYQWDVNEHSDSSYSIQASDTFKLYESTTGAHQLFNNQWSNAPIWRLSSINRFSYSQDTLIAFSDSYGFDSLWFNTNSGLYKRKYYWYYEGINRYYDRMYAQLLNTKVSVKQDDYSHPINMKLFQNFPNPFNPDTQIHYEIKEDSKITLEIFNILGEHIKTLVDGQKPIGIYQTQWDGIDKHNKKVPSGIYLCRLSTYGYVQTIKMIKIE